MRSYYVIIIIYRRRHTIAAFTHYCRAGTASRFAACGAITVADALADEFLLLIRSMLLHRHFYRRPPFCLMPCHAQCRIAVYATPEKGLTMFFIILMKLADEICGASSRLSRPHAATTPFTLATSFTTKFCNMLA